MKISTNGWMRNFSFPDWNKTFTIDSSVAHLDGQFGLNKKKSRNVFPWTCKIKPSIRRFIFELTQLENDYSGLAITKQIKIYITCSMHVFIKQQSNKWVTASGQYCRYIWNVETFPEVKFANSFDIFANWISWSDISCSCNFWVLQALLSKKRMLNYI